MIPVAFPPDSVYTSCYCEENIYLLCQTFCQNEKLRNSWDPYVVFISNVNKTVALWCQKAARSLDAPMIWDYHVILALRPRRLDDSKTSNSERPHSWVYDFDTRLSTPCRWEEYFNITFPEGLPPNYESKFRVIPGDTFLHYFASDRSHMLVVQEAVDVEVSQLKGAQAVYFSPPPRYEPLRGTGALQAGVANNLMSHYVAMVETADIEGNGEGKYGIVLDRNDVDKFFAE